MSSGGEWFGSPGPDHNPNEGPYQSSGHNSGHEDGQPWAAPAHPPASVPQHQWAPPTQQQPAYTPPPQQWDAPPPAATPDTLDFGAEPVEKKGGVAGRAAVVGLSLALIGGGAVALRSATSNPAGPGSPDEAAAAVFSAFEDEDFVGVIELMAPAEREAYIEPMLGLVQEVGRLTDRPVGDDFFTDLPFEIEIDGLEYEVTQLGPGVSWVDVTAGQLDVTFVADELPAWADGAETVVGTIEDSTESVDFADEDFEFAVVEDDGSWYWSAGYSAAESARRSAGLPLPLFNGTQMADGADTPEGAVQEAIDGLVDFDLETAFTKLDPQEFGVLYDYSDLFLDDAAREFASLGDQIGPEVDYSIDGFEYSSHEVRGRTVVSIDAFEFQGTNGEESVSGSYLDGCLVIESATEDFDSCSAQDETLGMYPTEIIEMANEFNDLQARAAELHSGITVVERDGQWYISGGPTFLGAITDVLAVMTTEDVDQFTEVYSQMLGGLSPDVFDEDVFDEDVFDEDAFDEDAFDEDAFDEDAFDEVEEYKTMDPAFLAPDYEYWDEDPEAAVISLWFGVDTPIALSNLTLDGTWVEVAQYASADIQDPVAVAVNASVYDCGQVESTLPQGATAYTCSDSTVVVTYGRWVLTSFGVEADPLPEMFAAQVAHLQSIGE